MLYRIYGHIVDSDIELLYCPHIINNGDTPEVVIRYEDFTPDIARCEDKMGTQYAAFQSDRKEYSEKYIRNLGYFRVSGGNTIQYTNQIDAVSAEFQQWILCYCMGVIMLQNGQLALHGSGLLSPDGSYSIDISGDSGSGKSTLTEELLRHGFLFQADDTVAFKMVNGIPCTVGSFPSRRLCKDAINRLDIDSTKLHYLVDGRREKYLFDMSEDYYDAPTPIKFIFILNAREDISELEIREAVGSEALQSIMHNLYRRENYTTLGGHPMIFTMALSIASKAKVFLINRPVGVDTSNEICKQVMEIMSK